MKQNRKYDVICIGTAIVDSIIRGFDPNPVSVSGFTAQSGTLNAGGEAVNESTAAAKLGLRTGILCFLGDDPAAGIIEEELARCGADTGLIVKSEEHPTPVTTMFVSEDGTRKSITNTAHLYNFHPEKYVSCLSDTRAVILGSLFRAPFNEPEIVEAVLRAAKENDVLVFADTKLPNFKRLDLSDLAGALPLVDYITPNEDEAKYYTGKDTPEEMADVFLSYGVKNVIIKLGGRGCYFKNSEQEIFLPACGIQAVDATGAGDNFIAGFVSEILRADTFAAAQSAQSIPGLTHSTQTHSLHTHSLQNHSFSSIHADALRFANACGAICTTAVGAGTALKSREQVCAFMRR